MSRCPERVSRAGVQSRCPERVHRDREALFPGFSSWDHQLGLVLKSRWDIEIPDCP